jgi:hypothetical protein
MLVNTSLCLHNAGAMSTPRGGSPGDQRGIGVLVRRRLEALQNDTVGGVGTAGFVPYVRPELLLALRHAAHWHDAGPLAELEARYRPAGPGFSLEGEIKNVVITLAKTYHYWIEHLTAPRAVL